jgi:hypothetical protein
MAKNEGDTLNSTGYFILHYRIPTQALRGLKATRELHVEGFRIGVFSADSRNYIDEIQLIGVKLVRGGSGTQVVWSERKTLAGQGETQFKIQGKGKNLSDFAAFDVALLGRTSTRERLSIAYVSALCWYDIPKTSRRRRTLRVRPRDRVEDGVRDDRSGRITS